MKFMCDLSVKIFIVITLSLFLSLFISFYLFLRLGSYPEKASHPWVDVTVSKEE